MRRRLVPAACLRPRDYGSSLDEEACGSGDLVLQPHGHEVFRVELLELGIRLERWLKQRVFGLLLGGSSGHTIAPASVDLSRCRRVLLVRVNFRMGNLLLITPAIAALRQALPDARIDVLCYDAYAALLAHDPDVDHTLGLRRRMLFNPWTFARLVRTLRRTQYDLVLEGARGGSFLGAFVAAMSGGRDRAAARRTPAAGS